MKNIFNITKLTKVSGICGILASLIFFSSILISIYTSASFKWTNNALSDLGIDANSFVYFNVGLILCGLLFFIFSLGFTKILDNKIGKYLLIIAPLSLIGVGLFSESFFIPHYIFSALFFISFSLSLLVSGIILIKNKQDKAMGIIACFFSIIAFSSIILLFFFKGIAIPEAFASFPGLVWYQTYGVKIAIQS